MIETENKIVYKAFGFRVTSELHLPELPHVDFVEGEAIDIEIRIDETATFKYELEDIPYKHVVQGSSVMFYIPNTAYYCVRNGSTIIVAPVKDADVDLMRLYILGTCMGAVLMQRKIFPLHGSAVAIHGKAYAIIGESGAGKSTLASALIREGFPLLSDDLIAVSLSKEPHQGAVVTPSFPQQKLWQASLDQFGMDNSNYRSIYGRETKFSVPVADNYCADPVPLAGVFELVKVEQDKATAPSIQRIGKLDRLQTLYCHTFRQFLIPRMGLMEWHFNTSAVIAKHAEMYQICRPESLYTTPELVAYILETITNSK